MKISEAKNMYATQLDALRSRQRELSKILQDDSAESAAQGNYDRVELSKELSHLEKQYDQTSQVMSWLQQKESFIQNAEAAKQQGEAMADAMDNMLKCLEIARRISEGSKVPAADEKMLMEYSQELYMAAKNMAFMNAQEEQKEYDTLIEEDEGAEEQKSASEIAGATEVHVPTPETVAHAASAAE